MWAFTMNQACAKNFMCFLSSYLHNEVDKYYCTYQGLKVFSEKLTQHLTDNKG